MPVSPIFTSLFKSLGANPTSINFNELYTALQTHLVDGQENGLVAIEAGKLYEVQKYVSQTNHIWDPFWLHRQPARLHRLAGRSPGNRFGREFDRAAVEQRADNADLDTSLKDELTKKGLVFESADQAAFRARSDQGRLLQGMARQVRRRDLDRARSRGRAAVMINAATHGHLGELSADLHVRQLPGTEPSKAEHWLRAGPSRSRPSLVVVAEVVILFVGIVARAVFRPADRLVGRTRLHPVPLAGDARHGASRSSARTTCG